MKKLIRNLQEVEIFNITVDVLHSLYSDDVLSSEIVPILDNMGDIDPQALADYQAFQETLWGIIDYYGFQVIKMKSSKSYPYTSKYAWIAYASDIENEDVPLMIKLRVSDHEQRFSDNRQRDLKKQNHDEAQELKLSKSKQRQRYKVINVVVNNVNYDSYEDALNAVDKLIHDWLIKLGVDTTDLEPFGTWYLNR